MATSHRLRLLLALGHLTSSGNSVKPTTEIVLVEMEGMALSACWLDALAGSYPARWQKFCSMRISYDVRDAAREEGAQKEGLAAMAAKYRDGGDLYMPVDSTSERTDTP